MTTEHHTLEIEREEPSASDELRDELQNVVDRVRERHLLERYYRENPYVVLAAAAGLGYVLGGGTFSPFSRRIARVGMKALILPIAASQIKNFSNKES